MSKKFVLLNMMLASGFAVAMDEGQKSGIQAVPKVDLTQLTNLDLTQLGKPLHESPVRANSMPSPHHVSPVGSPRPGNSPRPVARFLSQHNLASNMEKTGEGLNRSLLRLKECAAMLLELQGATADRQTEIREITNGIRVLSDRILTLERSHNDQQKTISQAGDALRDAIKFLQLTTPKKVNSQPLRSSPTRGVTFAAPAVSTSSSVATSSTKADDAKGVPADDQKSCASDSDDDKEGSDTD